MKIFRRFNRCVEAPVDQPVADVPEQHGFARLFTADDRPGVLQVGNQLMTIGRGTLPIGGIPNTFGLRYCTAVIGNPGVNRFEFETLIEEDQLADLMIRESRNAFKRDVGTGQDDLYVLAVDDFFKCFDRCPAGIQVPKPQDDVLDFSLRQLFHDALSQSLTFV